MKDRFRYRYWDSQENEMLYNALEHQLRCLEQEAPDEKIHHLTLYDIRNRFIPMLSIGLKDKNRTLLYERDIIDCHAGFKERTDPYYREIIINQETNQLELSPLTGLNLCKNNQKYFEIIGNIYENPNLLTTNKK